MKCVICKIGDVRPGFVQAEVKVGSDRLLVPVEAEVCQDCGEAYYSNEAMRHIERARDAFARKAITLPPVGTVYQVS